MPKGEDLTLFDLFVEDYNNQYPLEIRYIVKLLQTMGEQIGIREQLIKSNEGKLGDGVIALYDDPDKNLRLYGIRYGSSILVLGSGGEKSYSVLQTLGRQNEVHDMHTSHRQAFMIFGFP